MKLMDIDSLGQSFEFLKLPAFLAGAELDFILSSRRKKLEATASNYALFMDFEGPHTAEAIRQLRDFCHLAAQIGSACYVVDNVLLAKRTGAQGVLFSHFPESLMRLREVLGPSAHFGLKLNNQEARQAIADKWGADQIDFFFFEDQQRLESARNQAKLQPAPSWEKRAAEHLRSASTPDRRLLA